MQRHYDQDREPDISRSSYAEVSPAPDLAGCIERFWLDGPGACSGYSLHEILPDGNVDLLVSLSDAGCSLHLFGPATRLARIATRCANLYLGMRFLPGQAVRLADVTHADLLDARIELDSLFGVSAEELGERLFGMPDLISMQALLQDLLRRSCPEPMAEPLCRRAARLCIDSGGRIRVTELAHELGASIRRLERAFVACLGMSPKSFLRLVRLQNAVQRIRTSRPDFADLALACGFSDQAHMTREFRSLAGRTPSAMAQNLLHLHPRSESPEMAPEHVIG